jgi:hypothetical protein
MTSSFMRSEGKAAVLILLYRSPRPVHAASGSADSTRMMSIAAAAHLPWYRSDKQSSGKLPKAPSTRQSN